MKRKFIIWIFCFVIMMLYQEYLDAYSTDVHKEITIEVIDQNIQKFDNYFKDLGFIEGIGGFVNKKQIRKWIEEGSWKEDITLDLNELLTSHFHNPYTNKGLTEGGVTIGESAYDRANNPTNYWSWKSARDNYYRGLTSTLKIEREVSLSHSFKALGHTIHLIQDMGVPAHTRDDMHMNDPYENYTNERRRFLNYALIPFPYWNTSISPSAPKQFWDLDSYTGTVVYDSGYIGLSEYSHANFFSKDTIFKYFPHPVRENTNYYDFGLLPYTVITTPDNINHNTFYISGYGKQRLAALKYFAEELWSLPIPLPIKKYQLTLHLDNNCYEEYAQHLVPRTVGYSSGLLDYFFRGKLQVTTVPILYKNTIYYLRVKIKNMTPNETMKDGEFTLTYSYRPTGGNPDGSQDIWGQAPVVLSETLVYDGKEKVIDFWFPIPIPKENYDSAKFTLAFKGTLGNEVGAVIGKALTMGEIKFEEEWNNGLNGNHNWAHTGITLLGQNPDNGSTSNILVGDTFVKDNIRYVEKRTARVNESYVGYDVLNNQFIDILPIRITPDTYVQFKIDEMWINQRTPASPGYTNDWQHLVLRFHNGLGIQYTTQGQGVYLGSTCGNFEFDPNFIIVDNIYELFEAAGITIPPGDLYLRNIAFGQQLNILEKNSDMEHHQHMKIDSIRIIEGKKQ